MQRFKSGLHFKTSCYGAVIEEVGHLLSSSRKIADKGSNAFCTPLDSTILASIVRLVLYCSYLPHLMSSLSAQRFTLTTISCVLIDLPLGFDHVRRALEAVQEKCLPDLLIEHPAQKGPHTSNMLGREILFTVQPKDRLLSLLKWHPGYNLDVSLHAPQAIECA
jgi:hypothetical protein